MNTRNFDIQQTAEESSNIKEDLTVAKALANELNEIGKELKTFSVDFVNDLITSKASLNDFTAELSKTYSNYISKSSNSQLNESIAGVFGADSFFTDILTPNALGNAYSEGVGQLQVGYADQPSLVGLADHGLGVIGEAGPEAVLPLSRGGDGRLGVVNHGSGENSKSPANVIFNISTPDVESFRRSGSQIATHMARAVDRGRRNL